MGIHILVFKLLLMAPLSTVGKKIEHEEHFKIIHTTRGFSGSA